LAEEEHTAAVESQQKMKRPSMMLAMKRKANAKREVERCEHALRDAKEVATRTGAALAMATGRLTDTQEALELEKAQSKPKKLKLKKEPNEANKGRQQQRASWGWFYSCAPRRKPRLEVELKRPGEEYAMTRTSMVADGGGDDDGELENIFSSHGDPQGIAGLVSDLHVGPEAYWDKSARKSNTNRNSRLGVSGLAYSGKL